MNLEEEKIYYHSLNLASSANYALLKFLKGEFKNFKNAWFAKNNDFSDKKCSCFPQTIKEFFSKKSEIDPEKEWEKFLKIGACLIIKNEENYPKLLSEISSSPFGLYVLGSLKNCDFLKIAIVGTRKATGYGRSAAEKISRELSQNKTIIVSGLALGIDSVAHETALKNKGTTWAVLGGGFNHIFPSINSNLAKKIKENGALISEYHPDISPLKHRFPERNRIISGICSGVVVIEAPEKSGSMITAKFALNQNREVFTVPGSIFSRNSDGPLNLIKSGAIPINSGNDILAEFGMDVQKHQKPLFLEISEEEKIILEIIKNSESPIFGDEIMEKTELSASKIAQGLTLLELKNLIKSDGGRYLFLN